MKSLQQLKAYIDKGSVQYIELAFQGTARVWEPRCHNLVSFRVSKGVFGASFASWSKGHAWGPAWGCDFRPAKRSSTTTKHFPLSKRTIININCSKIASGQGENEEQKVELPHQKKNFFFFVWMVKTFSTSVCNSGIQAVPLPVLFYFCRAMRQNNRLVCSLLSMWMAPPF